MKDVKMNVTLIGRTYACDKQSNISIPRINNPIEFVKPSSIVISSAAKQCYNSSFNYNEHFNSYDGEHLDDYELFIQRVAASGHTSILEHASASFLITGVSRALSHQLVRHRLASYTQQSQRYVNITENEGLQYIIPPSIASNDTALKMFNTEIRSIQQKYDHIVNELIKSGLSEQRAREDARFILPNATATNLVMTMNYRELGDFLGKRMCTRAQWEIRELANKIFNIMSELSPCVFGPKGVYKGPKCKTLGYCNEHRSCGIARTLSDIKSELGTLKDYKKSEKKNLPLYKQVLEFISKFKKNK